MRIPFFSGYDAGKWFQRGSLFFWTLGILVLCVGGMIGMSWQMTPSGTRDLKGPLRIGISPWPGFYPVVIGAKKGFFRDAGVDVEYVYSGSAVEQMRKFGANAFDAVSLEIGSIVSLIGNTQTRCRIVLFTDFSSGGDAVVAQPEIKSIADLKGKTIGTVVGGFGEIFIERMLSVGSLTRNDIKTIPYNDQEVVQLLAARKFDAAQSWEPFVSQAKEKGMNVLFDSRRTPGLIADVVAFREKTLKERPEDVQKFVSGWFQAVDFWLAHPEEAESILVSELGVATSEVRLAGLELLTLEKNRQLFTGAASGVQRISADAIAEEYLRFYVKQGMIGVPVKISDVLEKTFLH